MLAKKYIPMNKPILQQLKERRLSLDLKQKDMMLRVGISRQQYQQMESKGNPRLDTLNLVAKGLKSELILVPKEKLHLVQEVLTSKLSLQKLDSDLPDQSTESQLKNNPWKSIFEGQE